MKMSNMQMPYTIWSPSLILFLSIALSSDFLKASGGSDTFPLHRPLADLREAALQSVGRDGPRYPDVGILNTVRKSRAVHSSSSSAARVQNADSDDCSGGYAILSMANYDVMEALMPLLLESLYGIELPGTSDTGPNNLARHALVVGVTSKAVQSCIRLRRRYKHACLDDFLSGMYEGDNRYPDFRFLAYGLAKFKYIVNVLSTGTSILYVDADVVFRRNPFPSLLASTVDIAVATAPPPCGTLPTEPDWSILDNHEYTEPSSAVPHVASGPQQQVKNVRRMLQHSDEAGSQGYAPGITFFRNTPGVMRCAYALELDMCNPAFKDPNATVFEQEHFAAFMPLCSEALGLQLEELPATKYITTCGADFSHELWRGNDSPVVAVHISGRLESSLLDRQKIMEGLVGVKASALIYAAANHVDPRGSSPSALGRKPESKAPAAVSDAKLDQLAEAVSETVAMDWVCGQLRRESVQDCSLWKQTSCRMERCWRRRYSSSSCAVPAVAFGAKRLFGSRTIMTNTEAAAVEAVVSSASIPEPPNPLLANVSFPKYDEVKPEHVVPGVRQLLSELHAEIDKLESEVVPTWSGLVEPLEKIGDRHQRVWGIVSHFKGVKDSPELRAAVEEVQPENVKLSLRLSQSRPLYSAFKALREGPQWSQLTPAQQRIADNELRDFVLGGVALEGEAKERFNAIQQELTQLATKFSNNVLDATKSFKKLLTDPADVAGLPATSLGLAAQQAAREGHEGATPENGPWLITLDFPSYFPVMTHAKNRALREELYRAYISRASSGDSDNGPIIERILELRAEKARLLGYDNFAELSMASKMASLDKAESLLEELRSASHAAAEKDKQEVQEFATSQGFEGQLEWWDVSYWAERLRESKYNISDEELRPYFALPNVLEGLFKLANRLFDVEVVPADGEAPVWHPDVQFFKVLKAGQPKAYFYLDPYSRPAEKRGGAWMAEVVGQSRLLAPPGSAVRLPVAHMVCNQMEPVGGKPSLMTFREVETLFHEFGHALQHMLTEVTDGLASGIRNIEWDAVELPSQFMENWAYDRATLYSFAKHFETAAALPRVDLLIPGVRVAREPLPEELYSRLKAAKNYRSGTMMLRQLHFSCVDLELHARFKPGQGKSVYDVDQEVAARTLVMKPLLEDRFLCSFSHIFAGGYSAGYYSYKWAEVLSADAFNAFEEAGLDNEAAVRDTGARFRDTVLALGGSVAPAEVFVRFRGREPSTRPLLQHNGLLAVAAA
ncbi:hypothetical protein VOLCADRAFT_104239 [Volvox carteri f. nagariensis]|uniref:oligopeptidase A n=1 Tax=Volvox carteri f. nagariensis TaxID=3068 RepID=D8TSA8_VOLCA|nr:uncharacterized protein VOLCADRAFT_104239 [Volvox carteri f. nagariensis]EFJ49660.1 hypothetical protein VOLCADRAFT_104239 [Volvox carteri f. nagariensis]|eukprot:XP_002949167.1 hypothetical protein VOLCADRAFT_104239 [Volvox carteri f. nagariensis]